MSDVPERKRGRHAKTKNCMKTHSLLKRRLTDYESRRDTGSYREEEIS